MSKNLNSERITFLLYLDDPIQSEIIDYLIDLNRSRKGEVLREIILMGWEKFNKEKLSKNKIKRKNKKENIYNNGKISNKKEQNVTPHKKDSFDNINNSVDSVDSVDNTKDSNTNNEQKINKLNPLQSFKESYGV